MDMDGAAKNANHHANGVRAKDVARLPTAMGLETCSKEGMNANGGG